MTNNDKATEIADYVVDLEERVKLWKALMVQKSGEPIAAVESAFEQRLAQQCQLQTPLKDQEQHVTLLHRIQSSTEDSALVSILHDGIFRRSQQVATL